MVCSHRLVSLMRQTSSGGQGAQSEPHTDMSRTFLPSVTLIVRISCYKLNLSSNLSSSACVSYKKNLGGF